MTEGVRRLPVMNLCCGGSACVCLRDLQPVSVLTFVCVADVLADAGATVVSVFLQVAVALAVAVLMACLGWNRTLRSCGVCRGTAHLHHILSAVLMRAQASSRKACCRAYGMQMRANVRAAEDAVTMDGICSHALRPNRVRKVGYGRRCSCVSSGQWSTTP